MITHILWVTILSSLFVKSSAQTASSLCTPTTGGIEVVTSISESAAIGDEVYALQIPGNNSAVSLTANPTQYFTFDQATRTVRVGGILDAEKIKEPLLVAITCEVKGKQGKLTISINVYITDANDHSPVFKENVYNLTIGEMTEVGSVIVTGVSATDGDLAPDYNIIFYSIVDSPYKEYFAIANALSAQLTLLKPLDYETLPYFSITIMAMDQPTGGDVQFNATCTLIILVEDQDDQNPVFNRSLYRGLITNTTVLGSVVPISPPIYAYDPDLTLQARIVFSFYGSEFHYTHDQKLLLQRCGGNQNCSDPLRQNNSVFTIDPNTAEVRIVSWPKADEIYILVQASQVDNPSHYGVTLLTVHIQLYSNTAPGFIHPSYQATIPEVFPVNEIVTSVYALDEDSGTNVTYRLDDPTKTFEIVQTTGDIILRKMLSYILKANYTFVATASDGMLESKVNVTILVQPVHNSPPQILTTALNVTAQRRQGEVIINIEAQASDKGAILVYSLLSYKELFSINSSTGAVTIIADPSALVLSMYPLTVVVSDVGQPSYERAVVVTVHFPVIRAAVTAAEMVNGDNTPVIVLASLAGLLLIIIIVLVVFICKRRLRDTEHLDRVKKQHPSQIPKVLAFKQKGGFLGRQTSVIVDTSDNSDGFSSIQENPLNSGTKGSYYNFGILNSDDSDIQELQVQPQFEMNHNDSNNNDHIYNTSQCSADSEGYTQYGNSAVTPFYANGSVSTYRDSSGSDVSFSPQASSNNKKLLPGSRNNGSMPSLNPQGNVGPSQKQELTVYF